MTWVYVFIYDWLHVSESLICAVLIQCWFKPNLPFIVVIHVKNIFHNCLQMILIHSQSVKCLALTLINKTNKVDYPVWGPVREGGDVGRGGDGRELPGDVLGELPVPAHHRHARLPPGLGPGAEAEAGVWVQRGHVVMWWCCDVWCCDVAAVTGAEMCDVRRETGNQFSV